MPQSKKNAAAVALGRLGGKKGGPARAAALSKKQRTEAARRAGQARMQALSARDRREIARAAARARWAKASR